MLYTQPTPKAPIHLAVNILRVELREGNVFIVGALSYCSGDAAGRKGNRKKILSAVKAYLKIHVHKEGRQCGRLSDSFLIVKRKIAEIPFTNTGAHPNASP